MTRIDPHAAAHARATEPRFPRPRPRPRPRPSTDLLLALLAATAPLAGCIVVPGDDGPAASSEDTASPDPSSESGATAPPDPSSESGATASADTADTGDSDTDDPTGGEPPADCQEPSVADARFSVELDGWPVAEDDFYEIAVACTVLDVQTDGADLVTTLECDDAGELRPATVRIAATDEGAPSWGPTSQVALVYAHRDESALGYDIYRNLSLRRADDQALLIAASDADGLTNGELIGDLPAEHLAPVVPTEDREYCGWDPDLGRLAMPMPMRILLELEGESLAVMNGQRGVLPIPGQTDRLAVDVGEATVGHCCHYISWVHLLVRRVS